MGAKQHHVIKNREFTNFAPEYVRGMGGKVRKFEEDMRHRPQDAKEGDAILETWSGATAGGEGISSFLG